MRLQNHSAKPAPVFFGKDDYHLGLELEVEAPCSETHHRGLNLTRSPRYCYAKQDGSLGEFGWELVTHPISRKRWMNLTNPKGCVKSFFSFVRGLRELGYQSHRGGRCGLHIHVSYTAFRNVASPRPDEPNNPRVSRRKVHLYWFMRLINTELFRVISQRDLRSINQWAAIIPVDTETFSQCGSITRYAATNITNQTIEVRIFRGNMREERIRKSIESVVAAIEFSRTLRAYNYIKEGFNENEPLIKAFLTWVVKNKEEYRNLFAYLAEIGQLEGIVCA